MQETQYRATRCLVINSNNEIALLVKRVTDNETGKVLKLLQVPGGKIEEGETPYVGMLRELEEELGIKETDIDSITPEKLYKLEKSSEEMNDFQREYIERAHGIKAPFLNKSEFTWFIFKLNCEALPVIKEPEKFETLLWVQLASGFSKKLNAIEDILGYSSSYEVSSVIEDIAFDALLTLLRN